MRHRRIVDAGAGVGRTHALDQANAGYAVDRRMVIFRIDRELPVLQTFDQVNLPQRAAAIQQRGMKSRYQREELPVAPRLWQRRVANVIVQVEFPVPLPVQRAQVAEYSRHCTVTERAAQICRRAVGLTGPLHELLLVDPFRKPEQAEAPNVHRCLAGFKVQEPCVCDVNLAHAPGATVFPLRLLAQS